MQIPMNDRLIITGGGTGGHIFPALAIAEAVKEKLPHADILFVGAKGRMEMNIVPQAGYKIIGLDCAGFQRNKILKNLKLPFKILKSLIQAYKIVISFKPSAVVGVGGYASTPVLFLARLFKIPYLIQEQNSYAGIANKILAKGARYICVAYPGMEQFFPKNKLVLTGNPIRKNLIHVDLLRLPALFYFKLSDDKKTILVIGGSLGAESINRAIAANLDTIITNNVQLIWQTGKNFYEQALQITQPKSNSNGWGDVKVFKFIDRMDLAYAAANLVISRAGALSIAELANAAKPCILVPSPHVADNHQTHNALTLAKSSAAVVINDSQVKQTLVTTALKLLSNRDKLLELSTQISKFAKPNAAEEIADLTIKLMKKV